MHTLFVICEARDVALDEKSIAPIAGAVSRLPRLASARLMTPDRTAADQPFAKDGAGPALALQLYFNDAADIDAGAVAALDQHLVAAGFSSDAIARQLMIARDFPVGAGAPTDPCLTFFVTYPGTTDDLEAWLDHYDAHHPPIMKRFPRIREVETCRPVADDLALPWRRATAMQRNKVVFDSLADLLGALASPVMKDMFADGQKFPPFNGKATHHPMTTRLVRPAGA